MTEEAAMKRLWAPWRVTYIRDPGVRGCIFCDKIRQDNDEENFILFRGRLNFVMMNTYPYNPGHLMVVPYRHLGNLEGLSGEERTEHTELVAKAVVALKSDCKTENFIFIPTSCRAGTATTISCPCWPRRA
jgi:ATP adenylyltransferase